MLKSTRAISPVIATLLLMVLAVAGGVVVYSYSMGWLGGATQNVGGQQGTLSLDSASCSATTITAYVRNIGGKDENITHAYVDDVSIAITPVSIPQGSVGTVTITGTYTSGITYKVKLVCEDGTSLTFNVKRS